MGVVTDPELLAQLNSPGLKPVTDPALLAKLNAKPSFMDQVSSAAQNVGDATKGFVDQHGRDLATGAGAVVGGMIAAPEAAVAAIPTLGLGGMATEAGGIGLGGAIGGSIYDRFAGKNQRLADQLRVGLKDFADNAPAGPAGPLIGKGVEVAAPYVGAATAKMGEALGKMAPTPIPDVPSVDALRAQSGALYDSAKQQGVVVKPTAFQGFASDLSAKLDSEGLDRDLQPKAQAVLNRIAGVGNAPIDITTLDNLRKLSTNATEAAAGNASDRRLTRLITNSIDDFVGNLKPTDTLAGDAPAASQMLGDARKMWSQQAKSQQIEDLINKANINSSGSFNQDQALRTQFQALARNPNRMSRFSPDEQAAILKVASGSALDQAVFGLGKMAPTNLHSMGVNALFEGAAAAGGNPWLGTAPAIVGVPAKIASNAITSRNARMASAIMRKP